MKKKRWREPTAKKGQLKAQWGKLRHDNPDLCFAWGEGTHRADAKPKDGGNICRACDWRPSCHGGPINKMPPGHNCRGYNLIGEDGKTYARADTCNVLFKRLGGSI